MVAGGNFTMCNTITFVANIGPSDDPAGLDRIGPTDFGLDIVRRWASVITSVDPWLGVGAVNMVSQVVVEFYFLETAAS